HALHRAPRAAAPGSPPARGLPPPAVPALDGRGPRPRAAQHGPVARRPRRGARPRRRRRAETPQRRAVSPAETTAPAQAWIGRPLKRAEDGRLLPGRGSFIDDRDPWPGVYHAAIVRSPHAHARIRGYDVEAARAMDGVVGVVTGADVLRLTKPFSVGVTAP